MDPVRLKPGSRIGALFEFVETVEIVMTGTHIGQHMAVVSGPVSARGTIRS